jgi:DNA-binding XRE family transcriptional regulator
MQLIIDKKQLIIGSMQQGFVIEFCEVKIMKFSEKLQILRKENKLSQEQLADMLDVSRQSVSNGSLVKHILKWINYFLYVRYLNVVWMN